MTARREALRQYILAEEGIQVAGLKRTPQDLKAYGAAWERYRVLLARAVENATISSYGRQYPAIFWLHHSLEVARLLKETPKRILRADTEIGRRHGDAVKYRIFDRYLDRVLSLSHPEYFRALLRYRRALTQRNAALRQGRADLARSFETGMAAPGAEIIARRLAWTDETAARFGAECSALGESGAAEVHYRGNTSLTKAEGWPAAFDAVRQREESRGLTLVGPQRDDLVLALDGHDLRGFGSTGQQRTAAVALKLCELATIADQRGTEPALLLDDVFAELDETRQAGLAARLRTTVRQVFVTAPRRDELPEELDLPVFEVRDGRVAAGVLT